MNIAILGSGNVGGTLGEAWAKLGHSVAFGARQPGSAEMQELLKRAGARAHSATIQEAVQPADVVVVALPWEAAKPVLESLDLKGKTVLDCTNPLRPDLSGLEIGTTTSAGEQVAQWARGASVVKMFNTTGANNMGNPIYGGSGLTMFYCGDDANAKKIAAQLAGQLGFDPIDAGPLSNARLLEPLALLWIWLAYPGGLGREFGFRLVKRP